jgi:hypothetical protein
MATFTWSGFDVAQSQSFLLSFSNPSKVSLRGKKVRMRSLDILRTQRRKADGSLQRWNDLELLRRHLERWIDSEPWRSIPAWIAEQCEWVLTFYRK